MDPRFTELAKQLVRYSTALKKDEKILLDIVDVPEDMAIALIREVRAKKGIPFVRTGTNRISRELLIGATDEQYKLTAKHLMTEMKDMDAYIAIRGSHNITETSDVA
ncbi:aminopeptidase, partial [Akkermansiaceae bacterium]|nr:aminopeptidase [Akkermansiaceae bacterium]